MTWNKKISTKLKTKLKFYGGQNIIAEQNQNVKK